MTDHLKQLLLQGFDYAFDRLNTRLVGMNDEEYLWEPFSACMSIRRSGDQVLMDARLPQNELHPPFTTIAGRLCHICGEVLMGSAQAICSGKPSGFQQLDWPDSNLKASEFLCNA